MRIPAHVVTAILLVLTAGMSVEAGADRQVGANASMVTGGASPNPQDLERLLKFKPEGVTFIDRPYTDIDQDGNINITSMTMPLFIVELPSGTITDSGDITISSTTMPPGLVELPSGTITDSGDITVSSTTMPGGLVVFPTDTITDAGDITVSSTTMPAGLQSLPFSISETGEFLVPTLSFWGIAILTVLLLLAGALLISRRSRPATLNT